MLAALGVASTRILAACLPKCRGKILVGSMNGTWYGDNGRHLFEWLRQYRPDSDVVWVTRNRTVKERLESEGRPVVHALRPAGWLALARADVVAFTNSLTDVACHPAAVPSRIRLVALRHGRSVKRVRFARQGHKISREEAKWRRREGSMIRYAISTSEFISDIQEECLQIGRHKHVVTGYPRNDELFYPSSDAVGGWNEFARPDSGEFTKTLLYAPSWRHSRYPTRFFPFEDFRSDELGEWLGSKGYLLLLRPHVNDWSTYPALREFLTGLSEARNVKLSTHEMFPDANRLLPFVDLLVTDYSAIYHDYLLMDRPMIFVPYDFQEFERDNGFLYDYYKYVPGAIVESMGEFYSRVEDGMRGDDTFKSKRRILRDMVHEYHDAGSSERVADLIGQLTR